MVTLTSDNADVLLAKGQLRIASVSCRIRPKLVAPRCFQCLRFGHVAALALTVAYFATRANARLPCLLH